MPYCVRGCHKDASFISQEQYQFFTPLILVIQKKPLKFPPPLVLYAVALYNRFLPLLHTITLHRWFDGTV